MGWSIDERRVDNRLSDDAFQDEEFVQKALNRNAVYDTKYGTCIIETLQRIASYVESHTEPADAFTDPTLYTGTAGIAYFYYQLATSRLLNQQDNSRWLLVAKNYIDAALERIERYRYKNSCSLLLGPPGVYLVATCVYSALEEEERKNSYQFMNKYLLHSNSIDMVGAEDEFLYGKAGFLTGLLNFSITRRNEVEQAARKLVSSLLNNGKRNAKDSRWSNQTPLVYQWHHKYYLGAAHGTSGVIHSLFVALENVSIENKRIIGQELKQTCEFLHQQRSQHHGNYYSSLDSRNTDLVQWCHGAPGFVFLFCKAAEQFKDASYLNWALEASDVVWRYGLLLKGPGLCHGIAGNAYCFLRILRCLEHFPQFYNLREKYYKRVLQMSLFLINPSDIPCIDTSLGFRIPDRPLSLFEGISGTGCFLLDLLRPWKSHFPLFENEGRKSTESEKDGGNSPDMGSSPKLGTSPSKVSKSPRAQEVWSRTVHPWGRSYSGKTRYDTVDTKEREKEQSIFEIHDFAKNKGK
eukprot:jgi/Galph1/4366/GphlegSOOS_G2961.1